MSEGNGQALMPDTERGIEAVLTGEPATLGYRPQNPVDMFWSGDGSIPQFYILQDIPAMKSHPQVKICMDFYRAGIAGAEFEVRKASKPEVGEFALAELKKFWERSREKVQIAYDYGWAGFEVLYKREKGYTGFDALRAIMPMDSFVLTKDRKYLGVRVKNVSGLGGPISGGTIDLLGPIKLGRRGKTKWYRYGAQAVVEVHEDEGDRPARLVPAKGFWFAHNANYDQWYGLTQLFGAWRPWRRLAGMDGAESVIDHGVYRFAFSGMAIGYPMKDVKRPAGGGGRHGSDPIPMREIARDMAENLKAGGSIAYPLTHDEKGNPDWKFDWPEHVLDVGALINYAKYLKEEVCLGVGVPPEIIEATGTPGSGFSGRIIPIISFLAGQQHNAEMIVHAWKKQIGDPLVSWNFGPEDWFEIGVKPLLQSQQQQQQGGPGGQPPPPGGPQPPQPPGGMSQKAPGQNFSIELAEGAKWEKYEGPHGGHGWKSTSTGKIKYVDEMPGAGEHEKEPHEMTRKEYVPKPQAPEKPRPLNKLYGKIGPTSQQAGEHKRLMKEHNAAARQYKKDYQVYLERTYGEGSHEDLIRKALAAGKHVPPEVLADYLELKPPVQTKKNTVELGEQLAGGIPPREPLAPGGNAGLQMGEGEPCEQSERADESGCVPESQPIGKKSILSKRALELRDKHYRLLSNKSRDAISRYTEDLYYDLNKKMRKCPPKFECVKGVDRHLMENVELALNFSLPEPIVSYRGIDVSKEIEKEILKVAKKTQKTKGIFKMPSITSTTLDYKIALKVLEDNPTGGEVVFHIKAKTGLYVGLKGNPPGSKNAREEELIQSSKTKYKVVDVSKASFGSNNRKRNVIFLEEV